MVKYRTELMVSYKNSKRQSYLFITVAVLYVLNGGINLLDSNEPYSGLIWILGGLIFIVAAFYNKNYTLNQFLEINNDSIRFKQGFSKEIIIKIDDIKNLRFKPLAIEITTSNGVEEISLAEVGYKKVLEIKDRINELVADKEIKVV